MILIDNDALCRMMEVKSMKITMFDIVVRKIFDVRYVSDLSRNLISVGVLSRCGLKIVFEGEKLK